MLDEIEEGGGPGGGEHPIPSGPRLVDSFLHFFLSFLASFSVLTSMSILMEVFGRIFVDFGRILEGFWEEFGTFFRGFEGIFKVYVIDVVFLFF